MLAVLCSVSDSENLFPSPTEILDCFYLRLVSLRPSSAPDLTTVAFYVQLSISGSTKILPMDT